MNGFIGMSAVNGDAGVGDELPLAWLAESTASPTMSTWQNITGLLKDRVGVSMFERWFSRLGLEQMDEQRLVLSVPNAMHQYWIEDNYSPILDGAVTEVLGGARSIEFHIRKEVQTDENQLALAPRGPAVTSRRELPAATVTEAPTSKKALLDCGLNNRFTFDSFVEGPNCAYSSAVAKVVAEKPGKVYNPLFLHGPVGLGKTHLMQAIGHEILRLKPRKVVRYVTSEAFTNEYIDALRKSSISAFRNKYRKVDVLLIDDIQFLAGKDSTQEEFFHTFNELFNSYKQVVLTSDRAPSDIRNLEGRLVSRFEWGLAAQIESPDLETRTAILRQKMADWSVQVDDWILDFLAANIRTNVRRLEGALMRVAAHVSLGRTEVTPAVLENMLRDIIEETGSKAITIDSIQKIVAEHYDIRLADMTSRRRPKSIAQPRQIAMHIARELTKSSLKDIGEAFGGKDHGTVIHACKTVAAMMTVDEEFRRTVSGIIEKVKRE